MTSVTVTGSHGEPFIRIVAGSPSAEEVAAVIAVLLPLAAGLRPAAPAPPSAGGRRAAYGWQSRHYRQAGFLPSHSWRSR